jgi:hypothetical protein
MHHLVQLCSGRVTLLSIGFWLAVGQLSICFHHSYVGHTPCRHGRSGPAPGMFARGEGSFPAPIC